MKGLNHVHSAKAEDSASGSSRFAQAPNTEQRFPFVTACERLCVLSRAKGVSSL